ncbi:MFS transporter [Sorangium cellulosum]|uniref:MFS transporter n=1 Tax=Sorangium cellulosum TaxID=56 RepID=A0A150QK41_SORCE|nr:MFS transporter [Sorangium cellulosum]KYF68313.1 MFS transporter [Sorangium cellulosum]
MSSNNLTGLGVLRHRSFAFYLAARLLSAIAVQVQSVAIGWQVYALTGDVFDLGLIGLAQFAPFFALILFAGQVADRFDRRHIISVGLAAELLCSALLLAFTLSGLRVVWPVFAVLVLFGSARAFMMPAQQAILMNLVPADSFGKAVALSSSSFHVAVIVGPTLGGLLYLAGTTLVYATVAALLLASLVLMGLTRTTGQERRSEPSSWSTVLEGLRFVGSRPAVLGAISLDLFAVLFGGAVALLPAYARDVLHAGPTGLGMLRTAPAVGAALTAGVLAFRPITRHVGRWMFGGVAVFGLATIGLGQTRSVAVALVALVLIGAGDMVSVYIRHILVQFETPDSIRGRVSAVNAVFIGASNELGEFESGLTARWLGLLPAVFLGGSATLAVAALWALGFPMLSRMDRFPHAKRDVDETVDRPAAPEAAAAT